jgi:hypothetical protein
MHRGKDDRSSDALATKPVRLAGAFANCEPKTVLAFFRYDTINHLFQRLQTAAYIVHIYLV